jgi:putative transposase
MMQVGRNLLDAVDGECLDHIVPLGERHLWTVVRQHVAYYHAERNHQGLGNALTLR